MTRESGSSLEGTVQFASSGSVTPYTEITTEMEKQGLLPYRPPHAHDSRFHGGHLVPFAPRSCLVTMTQRYFSTTMVSLGSQ